MHYNYTDKEIKSLLATATILVDTREQQNSHITDYLSKKKVPFLSKKLDYGDYSIMIPVNEPLGIQRDLYFSDEIAIERKASLDELANNLTADRTRFEDEMLRSKNCKVLLMLENCGYVDIIGHKYRSKYEPKSYIATLASYTARFNLNVNFIAKSAAGNFIYYNLLYHVRNYLLGR